MLVTCRQGAHINQTQFNWLGTIFYLSYLTFQYPQNLALQKFPVGKWMRFANPLFRQATNSETKTVSIFLSGLSHCSCMPHANLLARSLLSGLFWVFVKVKATLSIVFYFPLTCLLSHCLFRCAHTGISRSDIDVLYARRTEQACWVLV
jgi:hypothetical protein